MALSCGSTAQMQRPGLSSDRLPTKKSPNQVLVSGPRQSENSHHCCSHNFQLPIDGFYHVGGRQRSTDGFWVGEESQVVLAFLAELGDEAGIIIGEAITKLFKLLVADLRIPGRLDRAPALLKLRRVGFAEMVFGIALHVHNAELYIGMRKETLCDGQQAGEIILHQQQHSA